MIMTTRMMMTDDDDNEDKDELYDDDCENSRYVRDIVSNTCIEYQHR